MVNGLWYTILSLVGMSLVFVGLTYAEGCGGACVISGGSSYDFLGDPAVNLDMSSFDEFVRDNIVNNKTTLHAESLSSVTLSNTDSSINQTEKDNVSQNASEAKSAINDLDYAIPDNRAIKLGASNMVDKRLSPLAAITLNSFMF